MASLQPTPSALPLRSPAGGGGRGEGGGGEGGREALVSYTYYTRASCIKSHELVATQHSSTYNLHEKLLHFYIPETRNSTCTCTLCSRTCMYSHVHEHSVIIPIYGRVRLQHTHTHTHTH